MSATSSTRSRRSGWRTWHTVRRRQRPGGGLSAVHPGRRQAGSATLIALALTVFVIFAGLMALDVGLLVVSRARAQTAADLAALAALTPAHAGPGPGGTGAVAAANGAELVACSCGTTEAVVTVRRRVGMLPAGMNLTVTARARAVLPGLAAPDGPAPHRP